MLAQAVKMLTEAQVVPMTSVNVSSSPAPNSVCKETFAYCSLK